jgi:hypothetical protein
MAKRPLHRPWSLEDSERLRQHILRGGSLARATVKFARTQQALREQARTLGLKFVTIRELRKRAAGAQHAATARRIGLELRGWQRIEEGVQVTRRTKQADHSESLTDTAKRAAP